MQQHSSKILTLPVFNTHCASCKVLIEDTLREKSTLFTNVEVSLSEKTITVTLQEETSGDVVRKEIESAIKQYGYSIEKARTRVLSVHTEWSFALLGVLVVVALFFALGALGLDSKLSPTSSSLSTAFLVGLVASLSTCLAVVGGLVLSVSATYAQHSASRTPQILFHSGRIVGFFVLGGLLGMFGGYFGVGLYGSTVLGFVASVVMLFLGLQLLDIFSITRIPIFSRGMFGSLSRAAKKAHGLAPFLLGTATFFLPCGFTQAMQVVALSTGSFLWGGLTMFVFALGTLPVLATVSFGSLDLAQSKWSGVFFKSAGMVVILFALYTIHNALVVFGITGLF